MKNLFTFIACLIPMVLSAQGPIYRQTMTTNQFMNNPSDGWIAIWNAVANKWSNGVNVASSTNIPAYLQTSTLTNLAGTGLTTGATNDSAYIASSSGSGTNITLFPSSINQTPLIIKGLGGQDTWLLQAQDSVGNILFAISEDGTIIGANGAAGPKLLGGSVAGQVWTANDTIGTGGWAEPSGVTNETSTALQINNGVLSLAPGALSNIVVQTLDPGTGLSNSLATIANDTVLRLDKGTYTVTPSKWTAKLYGSTPFLSPMLANKTNVTIIGIPGQTIIDGSSAPGEQLLITNCYNVKIYGVTFVGYTNHNFTQVPSFSLGITSLWSGVQIANCGLLTLDNCRVERQFDQGITDGAAFTAAVPPSTNQILITRCSFEDIGSWFTNNPTSNLQADGTAVDPTGWTLDNCDFYKCMRGIETFTDASGNNTVFQNLVVQNCRARNMVEWFLSPASATNCHWATIIGNSVANDADWNYHGTNFAVGANESQCYAFFINGGKGWKLFNNQVRGNIYCAYYFANIASFLDDCTVQGNTAMDIDDGAGASRGFQIGDVVTDTAAAASSVRRMNFTGNKAINIAQFGFYIGGCRDLLFADNFGSKANLYTSVSPFNSAVVFGVADFNNAKLTNIVVRNNVMLDGGAGGPYGFVFENNIQNLLFDNNIHSGFAIADGVTNRSGTNIFRNAGGTFDGLQITGLASNSFIYVGSDSNLAAGTFGSGLTFSGGTLTASAAGSFTTNASQFGASTTLTLRDGVTVTNANLTSTTHLTNSPVLRFWSTANAYTEFAMPSSWAATNRIVFFQTNAAAGKVWKVNSVSISGGVATVNMTNDFVAGTEVTFSDPDGKFAATDITSALAELNDVNGSGPNASDGKVNWTQLVNVPAGFADGTDDGGAGGTNNVAQGIGTIDLTNAVKRYVVRYNNDTNIVVDWTKTNYVVAWPSNNFTVSWANAPSGGSPAQSITLEIVNTNSTAAYFPTNGFNGTSIIMLAAPSTNLFTFNFDGTNFWTESGQILTTGTGDTNVFNVNPVIHGATNILLTVSSNILYTYSTSDFVATNSTANSNLTVNFRDGTREIYLTNNISITNFTGMAAGYNPSVKWRVIPQLVNRSVVWPSIGNNFGIRLGTNSGSTLWTTLTNGTEYWLSFDSWNTNIAATITAFSFQ